MRGLASLRSESGHLPAGMVVSMGQHDAQFQQHTHFFVNCLEESRTHLFGPPRMAFRQLLKTNLQHLIF